MIKSVSLPHRRVIRFVGKDAQVFLQGLFSNDVLGLKSSAPSSSPPPNEDHAINDSSSMVYGAFLNGNGRVVTDGFVFFDENLLSDPNHGPANELFAEIDGGADTPQKLLHHLEAFKMRADVKMSVLDDVAVQASIQAVDEATPSSSGNENTHNRNVILHTDPRKSLENVKRSYYSATVSAPLSTAGNDIHDYLSHLYERGICEGNQLWSQIRLPFEGNLDIVGGIHYRKGCYIGQELVQRAKTQLVSRKRIVPFNSTVALNAGAELFAAEPSSSSSSAATVKKASSIGKIIDCIPSHDNTKFVGVCSLRLAEALNPETLEALLNVRQGPEVVASIVANVPYWWPDAEIDKCIPLAGEQQQVEEGPSSSQL